MKLALLSLLLLFGFGCAQTRSFEVTVRNESGQPLTAWLTKIGGPYEKGWKAPEELAWQHLGTDEMFSGISIPPGKTGFTRKLTGDFNMGSQAVLRIYVGLTSYNDILALPNSSPDRIDLLLKPGVNNFIAIKGDPPARAKLLRTEEK